MVGQELPEPNACGHRVRLIHTARYQVSIGGQSRKLGNLLPSSSPELTYADLKDQDRENRQTNLWSILYASGYLTDAAAPRQDLHKLVIPNKEVLGIYDSRISSWFRRQALGNSGKRIANMA
jgi:hypothetical protein